jgi:recombination protein RecR
MSFQSYPSQLLEEAVDQFAKLPGIGQKTAFRLVLYLLRQPEEDVLAFSNAIIHLRSEIKYCRYCNNLSDSDECQICKDKTRDRSTVCVVESVKDVISIEATGQYHGIYHVLGGVISPIDGIGPSDLKIDNLESRIAEGEVRELILALSPTAEGDTTAFYIYRKFEKFKISITTIARGVPIGDELEYTDSITLGKSIINRIPFGINNSMK